MNNQIWKALSRNLSVLSRFPRQEIRFTPIVNDRSEVYREIVKMRDVSWKFFRENPEIVASNPTLEETMSMNEEGDHARILQTLDFHYQSINPDGSKSDREIIVTNSIPTGRENGLNACAAIQPQRIEGAQEIKTLVYRDGNKMKAVIGFGDEKLMPRRGGTLAQSESLPPPYTINPATVKDLDEVIISPKLHSANNGIVANNFGSRFLSGHVEVMEYVKMIKANFLGLIIPATTTQLASTAVQNVSSLQKQEVRNNEI